MPRLLWSWHIKDSATKDWHLQLPSVAAPWRCKARQRAKPWNPMAKTGYFSAISAPLYSSETCKEVDHDRMKPEVLTFCTTLWCNNMLAGFNSERKCREFISWALSITPPSFSNFSPIHQLDLAQAFRAIDFPFLRATQMELIHKVWKNQDDLTNRDLKAVKFWCLQFWIEAWFLPFRKSAKEIIF